MNNLKTLSSIHLIYQFSNVLIKMENTHNPEVRVGPLIVQITGLQYFSRALNINSTSRQVNWIIEID